MRFFALFAVSALALLAGCAADATDAHNDMTAEEIEVATTTPVLEYRTDGGFTTFNVDVKVFPSGLVTATEKFHDGKAMTFTDKLAHADLVKLESFVKSDFASLPSKLYRPHMVADMPAIIIVAHGHTVTFEPVAGSPVAPASFTDLSSALSDRFSKTAGKELVRYEVSGGFAFSHTLLTITNDGQCHLVEEGVRAFDKECFVERGSLLTLHVQLESKTSGHYAFYDLPNALSAPPVADGQTMTVTWDGPSGKKSVASGTAAHEPALFKHVRETLQTIVTAVEAQH